MTTVCVFVPVLLQCSRQLLFLHSVWTMPASRASKQKIAHFFRTEELSARAVCLIAIRITSSVDPIVQNLRSSLIVGTVSVRKLSETHLNPPQTIRPRHLRTRGIMAVVHDVTPLAAVRRHRRHNAEFSTPYFAQLADITKLIRESLKSQSLSGRALDELRNLPASKQKQRSSELWNQFLESI